MKHRTFFKTVLLSVMGLICIAAYADDRTTRLICIAAYADDRTTIKIKHINPTTRSIIEDIPEGEIHLMGNPIRDKHLWHKYTKSIESY